jgi:hypothetical protein
MIKSIPPWMLVIIGILFNIASAIITHYFVGINNDRLDQLQQQVARADTLIESQWRMKTEIDRQQEFLLLLLTQSRQTDSAQQQQLGAYIVKTLNTTLQQHQSSADQLKPDTTVTLQTIADISQRAKQSLIELINDSYLERLEVEARQAPLKERNAMFYTVAIFLQLTGLILVLARDIAR